MATDEPDPTIQDNRLSRGEFFSPTLVRCNADEVLDGDAEGRDCRGGDSWTFVFGLCCPVGPAPVQTPLGQQIFLLRLSGLSSPLRTIHLRQTPS